MDKRLAKTETVLRLCIVLVMVLAICLVGFDSQAKTIAYMKKKVSFRDLHALEIGMFINAAAVAYNLFQLGAAWFRAKQNDSKSVYLAWLCYFLDQMGAYVVFAGVTAATQHSLLVVTGSKELQWTKWCSKFTRLCFQTGGSVVSGYLAVALMAAVSSISAFNLFRLYSPKRFLLFKSS